MVFIYLIIGLILIALCFGYNNALSYEVGIELNTLKHPYYNLGITFECNELDESIIEETLIIGLLFVNVIVVFQKLGV